MNKNIEKFFCVISLLISQLSFSQVNTGVYLFSEHIENKLKNDTTSWKYQTGAVDYSFVLNFKSAILTWEKGSGVRVYKPTKNDSIILSSSKLVAAEDYIVSKAESEKIIIINEAHHMSLHRSLTKSILKRLYEKGYRYLGLEALNDNRINERDFAMVSSGYYTQEPEFGNLIHEAKKLGFTIFGYEASAGKNGKEREIEQAKNIQDFMVDHPEGKYIIHCGYDHVYENEIEGWEKAMAGRLKEYLNIDPLTIDQVKFTERSLPEFSHYFTYAASAQGPFVLLNSENVPFNGFRTPKQTDIVVIHPTTRYFNNRPIWFTRDKLSYQIEANKLKNIKFPTQILAYRENEYANNGIPADYIEVANINDFKPLFLTKGNYILIFRNSDYEVVKKLKVKVKD